MVIARIKIMLKPTVRDAQGATVEKALKNLGYEEVSNVRMGKQIVMRLDGSLCRAGAPSPAAAGTEPDEEQVLRRVEEMCQKLLANPIIEDYEVEITQER